MFWILPFCFFSYYFLDQNIARFIALHSYPKWPLKMICFTFQPFVQLAFFSISYLFERSNLILKKMLINCIFVISIITILKILISRARPHILLLTNPSFKFCSLDFNYHSMPSSHACMSFALFLTLSSAYPRLYTPLLILSILICIARMLLELHFLSDCLLGAFLGISIALTSQKVLTLLINIKKG